MRVQVSSEWKGFFLLLDSFLYFKRSFCSFICFISFFFLQASAHFLRTLYGWSFHCVSLVITTASCFSCLLNATPAPAPSYVSFLFSFLAMDFQWSLKRSFLVRDHWALLLIFLRLKARLVFVVDSCYGWLGLAGFGPVCTFCR
jgi:hypothetical protein